MPAAPGRRRQGTWLLVGLVVLTAALGAAYLFALSDFVHEMRQQLATRQAQRGLSIGSPAAAIPRLRRALRDDPDNANLHYLLASALEYEKRHAEALEEYQEAVRLAPDNDEYLVDMGVCQYRLGDTEGSKTTYEKALEINPTNWVAHDNLGFDYYDLGDAPKALEHWQKAVELKVDEADIWAGLAIGRLAQGDESGAVQAYRRAVALNPHYLDAEWMKVEALWSDEALQAAEGLMEQARAPASRPPAPPTQPTTDI